MTKIGQHVCFNLFMLYFKHVTVVHLDYINGIYLILLVVYVVFMQSMKLYFYKNEDSCQIESHWFDLDTLQFAKPYYLSSFNGWLERYISSNGCRKAVLLKMQGALITLCCQV